MKKFQELYNECIPKKVLGNVKVETTQGRLGYLSLLNVFVEKICCTIDLILKPTEQNILQYKIYLNELSATLKLAKQNYYSN